MHTVGLNIQIACETLRIILNKQTYHQKNYIKNPYGYTGKSLWKELRERDAPYYVTNALLSMELNAQTYQTLPKNTTKFSTRLAQNMNLHRLLQQ